MARTTSTAAVALVLVGCLPPRQPEAHVTVRAVGAALGMRVTPQTDVSVYICARPAGALDAASMPPDAAAAPRCAAGEVQRGIFWDRHEPFDFLIMMPTGRYAGAGVLVTSGIVCGAAATEVVLARGEIPAFELRATDAPAVELAANVVGVDAACP